MIEDIFKMPQKPAQYYFPTQPPPQPKPNYPQYEQPPMPQQPQPQQIFQQQPQPPQDFQQQYQPPPQNFSSPKDQRLAAVEVIKARKEMDLAGMIVIALFAAAVIGFVNSMLAAAAGLIGIALTAFFWKKNRQYIAYLQQSYGV